MSWPKRAAAYILAIAPSHGIYSGTYAIRVADPSRRNRFRSLDV